MSTKIYHGYKVPRIKTIADAILWWRDLGDKFGAKALKALRSEVGREANRAADLLAAKTQGLLTLRTWPENWAGDNALAIGRHTAERDMENRRIYQLQVTLFCARGVTLCTLHSQGGMATEFFERHSGAVAYPYWDNSDEPEGVTPAQWKQRRKDWEEALVGPDRSGVPANEGLGLQTEDPKLLLWDVCKKKCPREDPRARALALAREEITAQSVAKNKDHRPSDVMEAYKNSATDPKTAKLAAKILAILPAQRSWEELQDIVFPKPNGA
jgi:hypothetical protein